MTLVRALHQVQDRGADPADRVQGDAEDDGQEDDLQDVALDERLDHAGRDDVGEELPPVLVLALFDETVDGVGGLDGAGVGVDAVAERDQVDRDQPGGHGQQGADLEVDQGLDPGRSRPA